MPRWRTNDGRLHLQSENLPPPQGPQEQLAAQVGVRRETIMRLEKAQYNPSLKLAVDISRAVDAPIESIFVFE